MDLNSIEIGDNSDLGSDIKAKIEAIVLASDTTDKSKKDALRSLLFKYSTVFQFSEYDVGRSSLVEHRINTGDAQPIRQKQYRLPAAAIEEVDKQLKTMERAGIVEPSTSP